MIKPIDLIDRLKQFGAILYRGISGRYCSVDRRGAERLYDSGKEPTVSKLLEYDAENEELKEKVAQLEKNSRNSSKPPSSDNPKDKNPGTQIENRARGKRRKPGGQPRHKGINRELIPVEQVNGLIHYYPEKCKHCGKALPQDETSPGVGESLRWQVAEIEPIKPTIIEHQCHTTLCDCGGRTQATLPLKWLNRSLGQD